jgi:type 1 glutamine amidotransferase
VISGRLLAVTGGHRYDLDAFEAMLANVCTSIGWEWTHVEQPEAQGFLDENVGDRYHAILLHDLPGLELARGMQPEVRAIDLDVQHALFGMLDAGVGIVATHHALAGWPAWEAWATALGGRFHYAPASLRGTMWPSSGYRLDRYSVIPIRPSHAVCAGVEEFEVTDELYLCPVFESEVDGLLTTDADLSPGSMISAYDEVVDGERRPAHAHPAGSALLGWAKPARNSPLVYLLPGHSASTMAHPQYRRLLANAVEWVASPDAKRWARANAVGL